MSPLWEIPGVLSYCLVVQISLKTTDSWHYHAASEVFLALNQSQINTKGLYFFLNCDAKIKHMRSKTE